MPGRAVRRPRHVPGLCGQRPRSVPLLNVCHADHPAQTADSLNSRLPRSRGEHGLCGSEDRVYGCAGPVTDTLDHVREITEALVPGTKESSMRDSDPLYAARLATYSTVATRLFLLSDRQLGEAVAATGPLGSGIGGW